MDKEELIARVSELGLPRGQYCVVGKGPLVVRGICEGSGIDILVNPDVYSVFKEMPGWEEVRGDTNGLVLVNPPFTLVREFGFGDYWQEPDTLFTTADFVDDVAFAPLDEIAALKRAIGEAHDQAELALINEYLYDHPDGDEI
ncbi:MAG: hypothetical protein Q8P93_02230 [bacterium]|nr:hypothetical protein [bacterium]